MQFFSVFQFYESFFLSQAFLQSSLGTLTFQSIELALSSSLHLLAKHTQSWLWLKPHVRDNSLFITFLSQKSSFRQTIGTSRKMNLNTLGYSKPLEHQNVCCSASNFIFLKILYMFYIFVFSAKADFLMEHSNFHFAVVISCKLTFLMHKDK